MIQIILSVAILVATIVTLANIITSADWQVKHLPKVLWVVIVIFVPLIGMVLWWWVGRDYGDRSESIPFGDPRRSEAIRPAPRRLDDDEDIDAAVEREIAFYENEARIRRLEAELKQKRETGQ